MISMPWYVVPIAMGFGAGLGFFGAALVCSANINRLQGGAKRALALIRDGQYDEARGCLMSITRGGYGE